jgi:hypothetical protein
MSGTAAASFKIEELEMVVAPDSDGGLCAQILAAAGDATALANLALAIATAGGWGWVLLVCYAGQ